MVSTEAAGTRWQTWKGLGRRLALKPYGDELLTRSADFWLFSARLIILAMATVEALAWGYVGSLMSRSAPLLTGAIAATFVFLLVWIVDATFMTLDLSRGFYERVLLGKEEKPRLEKLKFAGGVLARVAIVSASLVITAPFLAQAIFANDVREEMSRRNASAVAAKRAEVEQPFAARLTSLQQEQKTLEQQRVQEAAGVGPSGKYGRGPALETIERQLADTRKDVSTTESSRATALSQFDTLSRPQLEEKYGVRFLTEGVQSSHEVLEQLMTNPRFSGAETAVRAFLAFLFIGLLILKIFQPRSVAVYFSEQLHSAYDEYRKGLFDSALPEAERALSGGTMDPLRFEDWCLRSYAQIRNEDERRRGTAREGRMHELLIEKWLDLARVARTEVEPLQRRHEELLTQIEELEVELHRERSAKESADAERSRVEAAHRSMLQHIDRGGMDGATFEQAIVAARDLDERRRLLAEQSTTHARATESCARRLEQRSREAASLSEEIAMKRRVLHEAERGISEERTQLAAALGRQRQGWA